MLSVQYSCHIKTSRMALNKGTVVSLLYGLCQQIEAGQNLYMARIDPFGMKAPTPRIVEIGELIEHPMVGEQ